MTNKYKTDSDINLTTELRLLAKELKTLQGKKHESPAIPEHFVFNAQVDSDITDVKSTQVSIGKVLLERDELRQKENLKRIEAKAAAGKDASEKLLELLPDFAEQVSVAFDALGKQYAEILALSDMVRKTNMMLLNSDSNLPMVANLFLEPNHLHKFLKQQYKASFGNHAADVFIPQNLPGYDIVEEVKNIKTACTNKEEAA